MRELVFKNLTSLDKKRRDLSISETIEQNGIKTITRRHSVYIISGRNKCYNPDDLMPIQKVIPGDYNKRHIFIYKKRDTKVGKDTFVCDVVGKFYAVVKEEVYAIAFKHSFEIDFVFTETT